MRPPGSAVPRCESCLASSGFKRLCVWCGKERMFIVRGGGSSLTLSYVRLDARLLSEHTQTHKLTHTPSLHPLFFSLLLQGAVTDCAFSPSGETIASGSKDGSVRLWTPTVKVTRSEAPSHMTAHMTAHSTHSTLSTHGAQGTHNTKQCYHNATTDNATTQRTRIHHGGVPLHTWVVWVVTYD